MFNKLSLSAKITALAVVLLALAGILGIVAAIEMSSAETSSERNAYEVLPAFRIILDLQTGRGDLYRELRDFTRSSQPEAAKNATEIFGKLGEDLQKGSELTKTVKRLPLFVAGIPKITAAEKPLREYSDSIFSLGRKQREISEKLLPLGSQILDDIQTLKKKTEKEGGASAADKEDLFEFDSNVAKALIKFDPILMAFTDTTGLGALNEHVKAVKSSAGALMKSNTLSDGHKRDVQRILGKIGEYDVGFDQFMRYLNQRAQIRVSQLKVMQEFDDLVSEMSGAMVNRNIMLAKKDASSLSAGTLIVVALALVALILGIVLSIVITRSIIKPISAAIQGLSTGADQVTAASQEISSSSQSMASGSSEQAANLEEVSSSVNEISSMTKQTADNVRNADVLVKETGVKVEVGKESMDRLQKAVIEIQQSSSETAKILKDIDEIAFQTNLLALNAAVEAARAGEAGKGFAVVAEEVRNLAQRSAESAKKTAELIEASQHKSQAGVDLVGETAKVMDEIAEKASKIKVIVSEITSASSEQARGISQVSVSINTVEQVTQANASVSEELAASSEELSAQALSVNDLVGDLVGVVEGEDAKSKWAKGTHRRYLNSRTTTHMRSVRLPKSLPQKSASAEPHTLISFDDDKDFGKY